MTSPSRSGSDCLVVAVLGVIALYVPRVGSSVLRPRRTLLPSS